jgi:methylmalonyl-CoA mutase N-terminal domain/subunit
MRQYAGFSSAKETNERFRLLLEKGQMGLSVAFDLPTQLGMDSDDPLSEGEVGKVGVPIDSLEDMRILFDKIDLSQVSTSMTINAPAAIMLAFYVALSDERGHSRSSLRGTIQNDVLKEYIARGLYVFPPKHSLRLATDLMNWCCQETPLWNTISISGYHIREAGATAVEELAFTLSNALQYVDAAVSSGLKIDDIAPRLSFFFGCHNDFFEEVAKFRAARVLWHDLLKEKYSPQNPKSLKLRFHTQTAGVSLTAQQPHNNIVRVAYQALAAVLGGTQSLHTNSFDEALGLPTEKSATLALRTQQIIAEATGAADVVDPLAGSHLVEGLTSEIIMRVRSLISEIDQRGGALAGIEAGLQQRMIHESAWQQLKDLESNERKVIGVNEAVEPESNLENEGQKIDLQIAGIQEKNISILKKKRDNINANAALSALGIGCSTDELLMPLLIECAKSDCTIGEMMQAMRSVFGTWRAPSGM